MDMLINHMVIARYFMLFVITLIAVVDDYRRYKISNKIIIWGLVISGAMSVAQMCIVSLKAGAYRGGLYGGCKNTVMVYVSGMVTAFAVSYVVYRLKGIGAGDVKLLLVAGMFIGARDVLYLIGISLMAGVVIGVAEGVRKKEVRQVVGINMHKFHFSYAIMSGVCIMVCLKVLGRL